MKCLSSASSNDHLLQNQSTDASGISQPPTLPCPGCWETFISSDQTKTASAVLYLEFGLWLGGDSVSPAGGRHDCPEHMDSVTMAVSFNGNVDLLRMAYSPLNLWPEETFQSFRVALSKTRMASSSPAEAHDKYRKSPGVSLCAGPDPAQAAGDSPPALTELPWGAPLPLILVSKHRTASHIKTCH